MKLDRNINPNGMGKYALIKLRHPGWMCGATPITEDPNGPTGLVVHADAIDYGDKPGTDFFVIRLKDKYAAPALIAYADAARADDPEYADEIYRLAEIASEYPNKKIPD